MKYRREVTKEVALVPTISAEKRGRLQKATVQSTDMPTVTKLWFLVTLGKEPQCCIMVRPSSHL